MAAKCEHKRTKAASFGGGQVLQCLDCPTVFRPETPRPPDPAPTPDQDAGSTVVGPVLGWAAAVLFLIALVLGAVQAVTVADTSTDRQTAVPSPTSQCQVVLCAEDN